MSLSFVLSEQVLVIAGILLVQVVYGSYSVLLGGLLAAGVNPIFVVVAGSFSTFILLSPFAVAFERNKWPEKLSLGLMLKFVLLSFGGLIVYQPLLLFGIEKTTPAISSAMSNLGPALVFLIAACLRIEKFDIKCRYTRVKVLGSLMCLIGVLLVSLLQTSPTSPAPSPYENPNFDWIIGCVALFVSVLLISCNQILQAVVIKEFPAPMSLISIVLLIGTILTTTIQIITGGKLDVGSSSLSKPMVIVYCLIIGVITGGCASFLVWSMKKTGPVFVSMFNPISTIASVVLSALILRKVINLGSYAGIVIMFVGLYFVLWAKNRESSSIESVDGSCGGKATVEIEKPLLK